MTAGRRTPPRVVTIPQPTNAGYLASQEADETYFRAHPGTLEYHRPFIPGEAPEDLPPGTRVVVRRLGLNRVRAFCVPADCEVSN